MNSFCYSLFLYNENQTDILDAGLFAILLFNSKFFKILLDFI